MRQRLTLAAVLGGALLLTLLPPAARGAIGVARNDHWDFSRSLFSSVESGHLVVDPWTSAMLCGHLIWAWPVVEGLGESRAALQVATALIGLLGFSSCTASSAGGPSPGWRSPRSRSPPSVCSTRRSRART